VSLARHGRKVPGKVTSQSGSAARCPETLCLSEGFCPDWPPPARLEGAAFQPSRGKKGWSSCRKAAGFAQVRRQSRFSRETLAPSLPKGGNPARRQRISEGLRDGFRLMWK
jgi:hypothetical protein